LQNYKSNPSRMVVYICVPKLQNSCKIQLSENRGNRGKSGMYLGQIIIKWLVWPRHIF